MRATCDFCLKKITKTTKDLKTYKHHFCNKKCYFDYRRLNKDEFSHGNQGPGTFKLLKAYAEKLRKQKEQSMVVSDEK